MKNGFIIAMVCVCLSASVSAQKTIVTAATEKAFQQKFAGATAVKWDKEGKNEFEAEFVLNGKKGSANFSATGEWLETEMGIAIADAPAAVNTAFVKMFPTATIKEVYKIETSKGKNYFEIEYQLKGKTKEVKIDASGKIV
jgi:hypothetical protein